VLISVPNGFVKTSTENESTFDEEFGRCQFCQRFLRAFFVRTSFLCLEFGFEQTFARKICTKKVDEIDHSSRSRIMGKRSDSTTDSGMEVGHGRYHSNLATCLRTVFLNADHIHQCLFVLLGYLCAKTVHRTLVILTPAVNFTNL